MFDQLCNYIRMKSIHLDKDFDIYLPYKSKYSQCLYFDVTDFIYLAFPYGVPRIYLSGDEIHNKAIREQIGDFILTPLS